MIDEFLTQRFGAEYRPHLGRVLREAFAQAIADAATWFEREIPGLQSWTFEEHEGRRITVPVLAVLARKATTWPRFGDTQRRLLSSLPSVEGVVLDFAAAKIRTREERTRPLLAT